MQHKFSKIAPDLSHILLQPLNHICVALRLRGPCFTRSTQPCSDSSCSFVQRFSLFGLALMAATFSQNLTTSCRCSLSAGFTPGPKPCPLSLIPSSCVSWSSCWLPNSAWRSATIALAISKVTSPRVLIRWVWILLRNYLVKLMQSLKAKALLKIEMPKVLEEQVQSQEVIHQ